YQDSVRKSRRGQAKADLIEATQAMERHYTVAGSYTSATLPFARSPQTGTAHYNLSFETAPSSSQFKIRAVPVGTQARDACGTLSVDYRGKKLPADSVCWQ
ncbi:MAG: type IV pilin protein, partial [Lysobacter sp.]